MQQRTKCKKLIKKEAKELRDIVGRVITMWGKGKDNTEKFTI